MELNRTDPKKNKRRSRLPKIDRRKKVINMTEETPQQAARYTSFGHDFQKLVAASSGVSNPVFEMKLKKWALAQDDTELSQEDCLHPLNRGNRVNLTGSGTDGMVKNSANRVFGIDWGFDPRDRTRFAKLIGEENDR